MIKTDREMFTLLSPRDLEAIEPEWRDLAARAVEPNPFFEPFFLRPALAELGGGQDVKVLTVRIDGVLALLVPVTIEPRYRGLPLPILLTWRNLYDALGTPLVHRAHAAAALGALLDALAARPEHALELSDVGADGPFRAALVDVLRARKAMSFVVESHTRAVLRPSDDAEAYLENVLDGRKRKELRRLERRLAEAGPVEYVETVGDDEAGVFAKEFLEIEASGWKAERKTAMASNEQHARFFETVVGGAAATGQLDGFSLRAGGKLIAALCSLRCPPPYATLAPQPQPQPQAGVTYFAWKIAYDEAYAKSSPGILLEIENIRRLHAAASHRSLMMDSCASPDHAVSNKLWSERRILETIVLPASRSGSLVVSSMPLLQWAKRSLGQLVRQARREDWVR